MTSSTTTKGWKITAISTVVIFIALLAIILFLVELPFAGFHIVVEAALIGAIVAGIILATFGTQREREGAGRIDSGKLKAVVTIVIAALIILLGIYLFMAKTMTADQMFPKQGIAQAQQQVVNNDSDQKAGDEDTNQASANDEDYALNEKPANESIIDNGVWDEVNKKGAMVGTSGAVWYVQSGKPNSMTLHGYVKEGEVLEVDAYNLVKDGKAYSGGCILMINGPYDLDKNIISFEDGCAQIVDSAHAQELLDSNIAVKFARGDMLADGSGFSYKAWDLDKDHIWLPDGLAYHSLVGKLTAKNDDYPR